MVDYRYVMCRYPFDKVPVLSIDGTVLAQSGSISRFAAKIAGCYPEDPVQAGQSRIITSQYLFISIASLPFFRNGGVRRSQSSTLAPRALANTLCFSTHFV